MNEQNKPAVVEKGFDRWTVKLYGVGVWSGKIETTARILAEDINIAIRHMSSRPPSPRKRTPGNWNQAGNFLSKGLKPLKDKGY